ncbi:MAG: SirB2 family protein [Methylomonas sp.]
MLKYIHLFFVAVLVVSFVGRVMLAEFKPDLLTKKWLKITPHILDSLLLVSGIGLFIQGNWLMADYCWIVAKLLALLLFIGLGMLAMHKSGVARWRAFAGALVCLLYIVNVALTKQVWFFL